VIDVRLIIVFVERLKLVAKEYIPLNKTNTPCPKCEGGAMFYYKENTAGEHILKIEYLKCYKCGEQIFKKDPDAGKLKYYQTRARGGKIVIRRSKGTKYK